MKKGHLYWVTGLSGAGKTTIATELQKELNVAKENVLVIDGDKIREVYGSKDYTEEGRDRIAWQNLRLCKMVTDQGIDVICACIAMKEVYRQWNRENIENYTEIYLKVPLEVLVKRDSKGLYKKALQGEISNVYGVDMEYEEPQRPDYIICNDGTLTPQEVCGIILKRNKEN